MRTRAKHSASVSIGATAYAMVTFVGYAAAQQQPMRHAAVAQTAQPAAAPRPAGQTLVPQVRPFLAHWGAFASVQGPQATATVSANATTSQNIQKVTFDIPSTVGQQPKLGQTVFLSQDGKTAGFVGFPIKVPETTDCVGRGNGHGCFKMTTTDLTVSNTGIVTGKTRTQSEDVINGFTGGASVLLLDDFGNVQAVLQAGCWGVNQRSGRTEVWSVNAPLDAVLKTTRVQLFQYHHSPCGDKVAAFFADLKAGADAAGPIIKTIATIAGG